MKDLLKKGVYTGLGLALMGKDKVEAIVEDIKKESSITEEQGEELYKKIVTKSEEHKKEFETEIEKMVTKAVDKLGLATKKDIEELKILLQAESIEE